MRKNSIQIIIPVINLWKEFTRPCIDSVIKACQGLDYRILLIDQNSDDETKAEAGKLVSETFSHKRNEEQWPLSKCWNYGIKDARERGFEYVYVINNDVLIHVDAIKSLLNRFNKDERKYSFLYNDGDAILISSMDVRDECNKKGGAYNIFNLRSEDKKEVEESEHPNFSAFMIRSNIFDFTGEFDEGFAPAYFEDNDFHRRIKLLDYKAIVYPQSLFYHYASRTVKQNKASELKGAFDFEKSRAYFVEKWGGLPESDGSLGERLFKYPFNDDRKRPRWTKQNNQ